ncbi:alpha/beta hydrolase [Nocardia sp. NEAU-G5]|uniref:Alpha/beta hydrolase n=1 Tax=Nocardia albiluteola TaxID=2842303 RepID=A0ABS6B0C6_9NOCA|nr:alpha/beta fold hydrolase [Nocardia albiluteola]MBU3063755.1 alpha/beta hydrolase [Nocardia albiluteola]
MSLRHTMIAGVSALLLTAGATAACSSSPPSPLTWRPCPEDAAFECANLPVPVDWSHPRGATIDMAVIRKHTEAATRIGTLISLPGGPGTSGVDQILQGSLHFSPGLAEHFDLVSFDARGAGRSHSIRCDAGLASTWPNLVPDNGARLDDVRSYVRQLADSCRHYTGPLLDHMDAASVAQDVEALRKALGENTVTLYGRSYGTMYGQAYAEMYPQRMRALLLDSADDHSLDGPGFLDGEARAARDTFAEFTSWCARESSCVLHGADIPALYNVLFARAERGDLHASDASHRPLSPLTLSQALTQHLSRPDWPGLATDLRALSQEPTGSAPSPAVPHPSGVPMSMAPLEVCADWRFDIPGQADWARLWREQNDNAGTLRAHFAWAAGSLCSAWPTPPPNPPHAPHVHDAPRILLMESLYDPATPYEWATHIAADTPGTTLLTYDGWGHGIYDRTPCTVSAGDNYLINLTLPQPHTHCAAAG